MKIEEPTKYTILMHNKDKHNIDDVMDLFDSMASEMIKHECETIVLHSPFGSREYTIKDLTKFYEELDFFKYAVAIKKPPVETTVH